MQQKDMERFAFLYLCGKQDQDLLLGKKPMSFSDFDRLTYLAEFLGMEDFSTEIWNQYAGRFRKEFRQIERYVEEVHRDDWQQQIYAQNRWFMDFCRNVPNGQARKCLEEMMIKEGEGRRI